MLDIPVKMRVFLILNAEYAGVAYSAGWYLPLRKFSIFHELEVRECGIFPSHFTHTRTHFTIHTQTLPYTFHTHVTRVTRVTHAACVVFRQRGNCPVSHNCRFGQTSIRQRSQMVFRRRVVTHADTRGHPVKFFVVNICDLGSLEYLTCCIPSIGNCRRPIIVHLAKCQLGKA